jgi:hypothetical protein
LQSPDREVPVVQVDVPIAFAVGTYFADAAQRQLRAGGAEYYYRTFFLLMTFLALFFSWIPVYFLINYFSWEVTHMWWHANSVETYPLFVPIFLIVFFGVGMLGFLLGYRLVVSGRLLANRLIYVGVLLYSAVWIFGQTHRTFRVGTRDEWLAGTSPLFYQDHTFLLMLIFVLVVWAAGIVWFTKILHRDGRHLDADVGPGVGRERGELSA